MGRKLHIVLLRITGIFCILHAIYIMYWACRGSWMFLPSLFGYFSSRLYLAYYLMDSLLPTLAYTMTGSALFIHAPRLADESGVKKWGYVAIILGYCIVIILLLMSINAFPNLMDHWVDLSIGMQYYIEAQFLYSWRYLIEMVVYEFCIPFFAGIFGIMILVFIIKNSSILSEQVDKSKYRISILFVLSGLSWIALGSYVLSENFFGNIQYFICWDWEIPYEVMRGKIIYFIDDYGGSLFSILVGWYMLRLSKFKGSSVNK
jgi:hypothetical protein